MSNAPVVKNPCKVCGSADATLSVCGGCAEAARLLVAPPAPAASDPHAGPCSFCSGASDLRALFVGPAAFGEPVRLCDGCLDLCCDIIAEKRGGEPWLAPKPTADCPGCRQPRPASSLVGCCATCFARARAPVDVIPAPPLLVIPTPAPTLPPPSPGGEFACSFCHRPRSLTRSLVSGPRVFVCDLCVTDLALELEPHYWWPWERPKREE